MPATSELAKRQQQLVELIYAEGLANVLETDNQFQQGLTVYRNNLRLSAQRALMIAYPVVTKMIGQEAMGALANQLLHAHPPNTGDWGQWGEPLPEIISATTLHQAHPYLSGMATLEWKLHVSGRQRTPAFDQGSLALLSNSGLAGVSIELSPALHWQRSEFPLFALWQAHQETHFQTTHFDERALAQAIQHHTGEEFLLIHPVNQVAKPQLIDAQTYAWLADASQHVNLQSLLNQHTEFDFPHWLPLAIENQWITQLTPTRKTP